jgi:hypothetical protein
MLELGEIQATARTLGLAVATSEIRKINLFMETSGF